MIFYQLVALTLAVFCTQFDSNPCIRAAVHQLIVLQRDVSMIGTPCACAIATNVRMNAFSWTFAIRVGEASNPGPLRLAITNPTAILKKVGDLVEFGANVLCVAETSATLITQQQVSKSFLNACSRSFWSLCAQSQFESQDDRPSFRGEAVGSAIFSNVPCRSTRVSIPDALWNSARFSSAIVRLHQTDVLIISVYGFAGVGKNQRGVKMNDLLLTYIWDIVQKVGLPFIIAGDFNEPPKNLPIFRYFADVGAFELHSWYRNRFHQQLEPTCRGATFNDTAIFHPWFASFISHVEVNHELKFDAHSPVFIDVDFQLPSEMGIQWKIPQCWAPFAPPKQDIADTFQDCQHKFPQTPIQSNDDVVEALHKWSLHVEHAVHLALKNQHQNDSTRYPWNGLPKKFHGRCSNIQSTTYQPPKPIGNDRRNGYTPAGEVFSLPVKLKCKQLRRLLSFQRALKATVSHDQRKIDLLRTEWRCICRAKGFGRSWLWWIMAFEALPYRPIDIPDYNWLETAVAITKIDCDHAVHQEISNRQKSFRLALQFDKNDDFSRLTYKIVRGANSPSLNEVPACHSCNAALGRLVKGRLYLVIRDSEVPLFHLHSEAFFGDACILINSQDGPVIHFQLKSGALPSHGILKQEFIACSRDKLCKEFSKFWSPFWMRDSYDDQFDVDSCHSFQEEIDLAQLPDFQEIPIDLTDVTLWEKAIHDLKPRKAYGVCGWRHEELQCLPRCAMPISLMKSRVFHFLVASCMPNLFYSPRLTTLVP